LTQNDLDGYLPNVDGNHGVKDVFYIPTETVMVQMRGATRTSGTETAPEAEHEGVPC